MGTEDTTPADPREPLGRLVHETRLAHEADRAAAEGRERFRLGDWEDRTDAQHELDMRIGSAVATRAVADAKARNERLEMQVFALSAHRAAIFDALQAMLRMPELYESQKKRFRNALEALGGEEEKP